MPKEETIRPSPPSSDAAASAASFVRRYSTLKLVLGLVVLVVAVVLGAAVWLGKKVLTIDPGSGAPVGLSLRTDRHIATLIQRLEAYIPSLNRDHSRDTYSISLYLVPLDGSEPREIQVVKRLSPNQFSLAKILGSDGRALWFDVAGDGAVDLETFKLLSPEDVGRATDIPNPRSSLAPLGPKVEHYLKPIDDSEYLKAAYLRMDTGSEPIRLDQPPGALMIYTSAPGSQGTLMVARVDADGGIVWKVDTAIDRFTLRQILPGEDSVAFVGARLPVPDQLSEPLLVIVENATGAVATHSLWVP